MMSRVKNLVVLCFRELLKVAQADEKKGLAALEQVLKTCGFPDPDTYGDKYEIMFLLYDLIALFRRLVRIDLLELLTYPKIWYKGGIVVLDWSPRDPIKILEWALKRFGRLDNLAGDAALTGNIAVLSLCARYGIERPSVQNYGWVDSTFEDTVLQVYGPQRNTN